MDAKYPNFDQLSRLEQVRAERDIGGNYIRQHIGAYIRLNIYGLFNELLGPNLTTIRRLGVPIVIQYFIAAFVMTMLATSYFLYAVGFIRHIRSLNWLDWVIFLTVVYLMASTAVLGYSRYRLAFYTICLVGTFSCWRHHRTEEV